MDKVQKYNSFPFNLNLYTDEATAFDSQQGQGRDSFIFTTASRPDLEPTQPPIQWVPSHYSSGGKVTGT
jgi:hypothetical protein